MTIRRSTVLNCTERAALREKLDAVYLEQVALKKRLAEVAIELADIEAKLTAEPRPSGKSMLAADFYNWSVRRYMAYDKEDVEGKERMLREAIDWIRSGKKIKALGATPEDL